MDAASGGIVRYTYVSPSFVMGTTMIAKLPLKSWNPASSQNRWNGLILSGGPDRYLFVSPGAQGERSNIYNAEWGVQHKGCQIIQRLPRPFSANAGDMTVWVGSDLKPELEGDWMFIDSSAYVAVRPAFGGFERSVNMTEIGQPFVLKDGSAPVIVQVADKSEFPDFAAFKTAVLSAPLTISDELVRFRGLGEAGEISFYYRSGDLPEINGQPIDLAPRGGFESPFLKSTWGEGIVTIQMNSDELVRDFAK